MSAATDSPLRRSSRRKQQLALDVEDDEDCEASMSSRNKGAALTAVNIPKSRRSPAKRRRPNTGVPTRIEPVSVDANVQQEPRRSLAELLEMHINDMPGPSAVEEMEQEQNVRKIDSFACSACTRTFNRHNILHAHMAFNHENSVMCTQCNKSAEILRNSNVCKTCGEYAHNMAEHEQTHFRDKIGRGAQFECPICYRSFTKMYDMKMHLARAHKMKKARFPCRWCKQGFSTRYARDRHASTHAQFIPNTDDVWQNVCRLQEEMGDSLLPYQCPLCHYILGCRKSLRNHVIIKHRSNTADSHSGNSGTAQPKTEPGTSSTDFNCRVLVTPKVEAEISSEEQLTWIKVWSDEPASLQEQSACPTVTIKCEPGEPIPVVDTIVPAGRPGVGAVGPRGLVDSRPLFNCWKCDRRFKSAQFLQQHVLTEHYEKQIDFACDICGHVFPRKYTMLLHRMEHETMEFRRQQIDKYLLEIQSPVNGKTRYHCTGCTASFHDMAGLQCHVLVKHVSLNSAPKTTPTKQNDTGAFEHQACSSTAARDIKTELDEPTVSADRSGVSAEILMDKKKKKKKQLSPAEEVVTKIETSCDPVVISLKRTCHSNAKMARETQTDACSSVIDPPIVSIASLVGQFPVKHEMSEEASAIVRHAREYLTLRGFPETDAMTAFACGVSHDAVCRIQPQVSRTIKLSSGIGIGQPMRNFGRGSVNSRSYLDANTAAELRAVVDNFLNVRTDQKCTASELCKEIVEQLGESRFPYRESVAKGILAQLGYHVGPKWIQPTLPSKKSPPPLPETMSAPSDQPPRRPDTCFTPMMLPSRVSCRMVEQ